MSPAKHVAMGITGGVAIYTISRDTAQAIGFFIGSWAIDLDHVWQYWRINHFEKPFAVKDFLKFNDALTEKFINGQTWLHVLFMHTIEFFLTLLILALSLNNYIIIQLLYGALIGIFIHLVLDDIFLYKYVGVKFLKRAHSLIEYHARKRIFKEK